MACVDNGEDHREEEDGELAYLFHRKYHAPTLKAMQFVKALAAIANAVLLLAFVSSFL